MITNGLPKNHVHLETSVDPKRKLAAARVGPYAIRALVTQRDRDDAGSKNDPEVVHRALMGDLVLSIPPEEKKKKT